MTTWQNNSTFMMLCMLSASLMSRRQQQYQADISTAWRGHFYPRDLEGVKYLEYYSKVIGRCHLVFGRQFVSGALPNGKIARIRWNLSDNLLLTLPIC